jgi:AcrR family transcriptional regulator
MDVNTAIGENPDSPARRCRREAGGTRQTVEVARERLTKRERTRLALLEGAVAVIAEKGLAETRITDVTDRVGVSNGTFYNYFPDKDALVRAVVVEVAGGFAGSIDAGMAGEDDAVRRVVLATSQAVDGAVAEPSGGAVLMELIDTLSGLREPVLRFLRQDLERGVEQGVFALELTPFLLEQVLALVISSVRAQLRDGADGQITALTCEHVLRLCGLTPAAARRAVEGVLGRR